MRKYALLIGVSNYQNQDAVQPSPSARKDVEVLREILLHPEIGGFTEVLPVLNPDRMAMEEAIEEFFSKCNRDDLALMFFSGRGVRDERGRAYFATASTRKHEDGRLVRATALPANSVQDLMGSSRCRQQVMILDCGFGGDLDPVLVAEQNGSFSLKNQLGAQGRVIMVASDDVPAVTDGKESELSLYTHCLVEGIMTGAADRNHDGEVSVHELHEYTRDRVQQMLPAMHPEIIALRDEDFNINLARVPLIDPHRRYREDVERYVVEGKISPVARAILDQQRSQLHLSPAEALLIENEVLRPYREYAESLQRYRKALTSALEEEYPLSQRLLSELRDLQDILKLTDEAVEPIQQELTQPYATRAEVHRQKLIRYEQEFLAAIAQEDPPGDAARLRLRQLQQSLGLKEPDVIQLEQHLIAQNQAQRAQYHQHLRQYEQEFARTLEQERSPSAATRLRLTKLQHSLGLQDEHTATVEQQVLAQVEAQEADYQQKLAQYGQEFRQAIVRERVLGKLTRDRLLQLQLQLGLQDADIMQVERQEVEQIESTKQQYQENLRRYQQALTARLAMEFPLSDVSRAEFQQLQESLMLKDDDVAAIQRQLTVQAEIQRKDHERKRRQYEQEVAWAIAQEEEIGETTRQRLTQLWRSLGLKPSEAEEIEQRLATDLKGQLEAYSKRLQQYDQEFNDAIRSEPSLSDDSRHRLNDLRLFLELRDEDANLVETSALMRRDREAAAPAVEAEHREHNTIPLPSLEESTETPSHANSEPEITLPRPASNAESEPPAIPLPELNGLSDLGQAPTPPTEFTVDLGQATPPAPPPDLVEPPAPSIPKPLITEVQPAPIRFEPGASPSDLGSERGIDYRKLRDLLEDQLWEEADRETYRVMLAATGRQPEGWLSPKAIASFPGIDLHTINQLWTTHSKGRFGFSVQERIYNELPDPKQAIAFGKQVKWVVGEQSLPLFTVFKLYDQLIFTLNAPAGHLPALWFWKLSWWGALRSGAIGTSRAGGGGDIQMLASLMQRLRECGIR